MNVYKRTALTASFCLVLGLGVAACGKKAPQVSAPPPPPPTVPTVAPPPPAPPPPAQPPAAPRALSEDELFARASNGEIEKNFKDVFFDLDQSSIKDDARTALQANAAYMKRWSSIRVNVEGHCDERGTAEYNLGLGDRRGTAVKDYLVSLGVPASSITVVSKGKEAPFCTDHNESCWQQNRRGHFVVMAK